MSLEQRIPNCKPCQLGLLADVFIEALSRSRVALPLITAFGLCFSKKASKTTGCRSSSASLKAAVDAKTCQTRVPTELHSLKLTNASWRASANYFSIYRHVSHCSHRPCQRVLISSKVLGEPLSPEMSAWRGATVSTQGFSAIMLTSFITKLVSMMAENPCVETVAPLQALISGLKGSPRSASDPC
jgi:hypothetical protein